MSKSKKEVIDQVREKFKSISVCLNERGRRIWAATEARSYGWGGIILVSAATGISRKTICQGLKEIQIGADIADEDIRVKGGGRKSLLLKYPHLLTDLENLLEPITRGDPESPLLWSCKSTYKLASELQKLGYEITQRSVCDLLSDLGYSLQANQKSKEGTNHPDRDSQFEHINNTVKQFQSNHAPVISVDTKKKENLGNFKNAGHEYSKKGEPVQVNSHDFPDPKLGKAVPYGIYDLTQNKGWMSVGINADTAEFAVNAIRSWWENMGRPAYPKTSKLMITADCGGSNSYRTRLWKKELQSFANETGLDISVCHFPPGTSKWNKIEHRMFSFITMNWRGKPLINLQTVINLIGNTTTKQGLEIQATLDKRVYQKGIKVSDGELEAINIQKNEFHGEWNYTISPQKIG